MLRRESFTSIPRVNTRLCRDDVNVRLQEIARDSGTFSLIAVVAKPSETFRIDSQSFLSSVVEGFDRPESPQTKTGDHP